MHKFIYNKKREYDSYAQRSVIMGCKGMVASSQSLATLSGYKALNKGGNAIDACVAMLSTQSVVEPHSVGIGGDCFALIYINNSNKLIGLDGSGRSAQLATIEKIKNIGYNQIPERGILTATVPGALKAWSDAVDKYGHMEFADLLCDAIYYAENGFPVTEVISGEWKNAEEILRNNEYASTSYLRNGFAPSPGQIFKNENIANTFKKISEHGTDVFYHGELADKIDQYSKKMSGLIRKEDLEKHKSIWVEPISIDYRGLKLYEMPPPCQGVTALEILNIMKEFDFSNTDHNSSDYLHKLIESKKIAYANRDKYITDPEFHEYLIEILQSAKYIEECREIIENNIAYDYKPYSNITNNNETVYVTAVDKHGNVASFISSIFMHFGSGDVVYDTGIVLQNRGTSFSLNENHRNKLEPSKRTMHTIIPAMLFQNNKPILSFGVMGGDMQPQGHVQLICNIVDFNMNIQEAVDAPRIRHFNGKQVHLEDGITENVKNELSEKGHLIDSSKYNINMVGGAQAIYIDRFNNTILGASDRRKDGCAIGY